MKGIASPIAQAIYFYIPSRAVHRTKENPFQITLSNLLEQIGIEVPKTKSERKRIFEQHKEKQSGSILSQLNGLEVFDGFLRVDIELTSDKSDYKFLAWVEKNGLSRIKIQDVNESSKLYQVWISSGKSRDLYVERLSNLKPLSDYELELLAKCSISLEENRVFLEQAKALLGEASFISVLADIKSGVLEKRRVLKNNKAKFIFLIMEAVKNKTISCILE